MAIEAATVMVSLAGSGGVTAIVVGLFDLFKMSRPTRAEIGSVRLELVKCQGDCLEAKERALRAELRADESDRRLRRVEEDAQYWRRRYEREHPQQGGSHG